MVLPRASTGPSKTGAALVTALKGLSDGLYGMFSQRLELFRLELLDDVHRQGLWAIALVISAVVLVLGYGMLNLALVLAVGWLAAGLGPMALTALVLALTNTAVAALAVRMSIRRLTEGRIKMRVTLDEFKKDRKWLRDMVETSPPETQQGESSRGTKTTEPTP